MQGFFLYYNFYKNIIWGKHDMLKLRVLKILEEQNHTKYWLYKQMDLSYQNFNRMVMNETSSIKFDNLEKLSQILNCTIDELFERTSDTN